jgi:glycopeptide antibiotics resistance protein
MKETMGHVQHGDKALVRARIATGSGTVALILLVYALLKRFPQLVYPLLPYRSFAFPILVLSLIVVPCWLVFRLYRHRTGGRPLSFQREMLLLTVVLYLAGLVAATLTPNRSSRLRAEGRGGMELHPRVASLTCSSPNMPSGSRARAFCVHNARGNVLLFFPLGILIPLLWKHLRFWRGMQIAFALSVGIELVQYLSSAWGSYRAADVNDVILNVFGASLGLALVSLFRLRPGTRPAVPRA